MMFGLFPLLGFFLFFLLIRGLASAISRPRGRPEDSFLSAGGRSGTAGRIEGRADDGGREAGREAKVFRLASRNGGVVTVSDIVMGLGGTVKEAEETMDGMVDGMRVRMEVRDDGRVVYEFPEIVERIRPQASREISRPSGRDA